MSYHEQQNLGVVTPVSKLGKWFNLARLVGVGVSVIGAIPTAINVYYGWQYDISPWEVQHKLSQGALFERNFGCAPDIEYQKLNTGHGTRVDAGACPKTGDIAIRVAAETGEPVLEWISYEKLRKPGASPSFFEFILPRVRAEGATVGPAAVGLRLAQAGIRVVCQVKSAGKIVQIVNDGGRCYRETFSPVVGRVEKREEVPCGTPCPAS
jgi:hypothetical protein